MGLNNLTFEKNRVIGTVVQNREKHIAEFNAAYDGWLKKCRELVEDEAQRQADWESPSEDFRFPSAPVSHEEDYNRVIDMLELSEDETVVLSASEFDMYMRDEWGWKFEHTQTFVAYTG